MKKLFILFTILSFYNTITAQKNFIDINYITVSGTAEEKFEPDEIYLTINLDENDFKKGVNIEDKEIEMVNALKKLSIDTAKDLRIQSYNGDFKHFFLKKNNVVKHKKYELLVHDFNKLSAVFYELDKMNISNIYISKVSHSKIEELRFQLKAKAIKVAKKKASNYAEAIDQAIGKALHIQEGRLNDFSNNYLANTVLEEVVIIAYNNKPEKKVFPKLNIKKITISATVEVKFELK